MKDTIALIRKYYDAFNKHDMNAFLGCLSDDVVHDINQGKTQIGKKTFADFMQHMNECYQEKADNIIIMATDDGKHAAVEFMIEGTYLKTDQGLPEAKGQRYRLKVGAFFQVNNGKITHMTNYYNLNDWLSQVKNG